MWYAVALVVGHDLDMLPHADVGVPRSMPINGPRPWSSPPLLGVRWKTRAALFLARALPLNTELHAHRSPCLGSVDAIWAPMLAAVVAPR